MKCMDSFVTKSDTSNGESSKTELLSYQQSFGFFDDIPDEDWKRMQQIKRRTWPNHNNKSPLDKFAHSMGTKDWKRKSNWWYAENFQEEFHCRFAERLPASGWDGLGDGPKWVCDPFRIAKQKDCLVYSIGSNGNVMFEAGVKDQISKDCEIHTFDPGASNTRFGDFAEALKPYSTFHQWALGTDKEAKRRKNTKTLDITVTELGHEGRRIDIFKIDCELCEWSTYEDWLKYDIRQILVETHNAPDPNIRDFFYKLHDAGYVIFSKEGNWQNQCGGAEYAFIKLSTDFMIDGSLYNNYLDK